MAKFVCEFIIDLIYGIIIPKGTKCRQINTYYKQ